MHKLHAHVYVCAHTYITEYIYKNILGCLAINIYT